MKKKKNKKRRQSFGFGLLFLMGFLIMMYPMFSQWYYRVEASREIASFEGERVEMDPALIAERMALARAYNETLDPSRLSDPYTELEERGRAEYARMLEIQEKIGHVEIPKMNEDIPIYAGTSESILQKGAGHLEGTSLPIGGNSTHTVITAHRGLPTKKLFRQLDRLHEGDVFYIHNIETVLAYEVDQILTVEPTNFEPVLVVEGEDYATLLTCTPYMINSHRLLVRGHRIPYTPPVDESKLTNLLPNMDWLDYLKIALFIVLLLSTIAGYQFKEERKVTKKVKSYEKETKDD
ncbi:class C sortase [Peptoniphilus sp. KCTC 25270]|uniref:class C sortase n=1 Tax=Peptoniphilus sp. KCTC 25270 TaxID=2897414 RepID=UPI001E523C8F|nr:class C sortase [Peptoniphilus sp. KCTC 25270]MCD1147746.1 class C sortase [Peptoniphilus sp. KCTC 25270]